MRPRRLHLPILLSVVCVAAIAACGGGGGGGGPAPAPPVVQTTNTATPAQQTQMLAAGSAPASASFGAISSGLSASETLSAASAGAGAITSVFSSSLPAGFPTVQSTRRMPRAIGGSPTILAYFSFTPSATITFPQTPGFTITSSTGFSTTPVYYIGVYSVSAGWMPLLGPSISTGTTVTFAPAFIPTTFAAGVTYTYVFFSAPSTSAIISIAIPTPSPSPTVTPVPLATAGPALAYMSAIAANTFASAISARSRVGILIDDSTPYITNASASTPSLTLDSTLTVKVGTSVGAFSNSRLPLSQLGGNEVPSGNRKAPTVLRAGRLLPDRIESEQNRGELVRLFATAAQSRSRVTQSFRRAQSLPTAVGATSSFWVNNAAIGVSSPSFASVPATLGAVSSHGYIWVDNSLTLTPQSIAAIGADFDNAYASDVAHFGTPEYTLSSAGALRLSTACDSTGVPIPNSSPVPVLISPPNGMHVVLVVNPANVGSGVGGYFSSVNHLPQPIANCLSGQPKSNEASMIVVGYDATNSLQYELQEDLVRSTAHELQHLINFVNHSVLSSTPKSEAPWINEGLSMLAQDFAVRAMFPNVSNDADDAVARAGDFMTHPGDFSLTGFTGLENGTDFSYNCSGCYGVAFLYQRYLYDRFGGDTYSKSMESNGSTGIANLQAATGEVPSQSIADFGLALVNGTSGVSSDPRFTFTHFDPYGTYLDQFGQTVTLQGPFVRIAAIGQTTTFPSYIGTFRYIEIEPNAGQGAGVTVSDPSGALSLTAALFQF